MTELTQGTERDACQDHTTIARHMNAVSLRPTIRTPRKRPNRSEAKAVAYARDILELMHADATDPKTKPLARASIARSFAILGDAIRVWRGIPSPGQYRPDLDPAQLSKAMKRARARLPIEMAAQSFEAPEEEREETPHEKKKESLLTTGTVTTEGEGEGRGENGRPLLRPPILRKSTPDRSVSNGDAGLADSDSGTAVPKFGLERASET